MLSSSLSGSIRPNNSDYLVCSSVDTVRSTGIATTFPRSINRDAFVKDNSEASLTKTNSVTFLRTVEFGRKTLNPQLSDLLPVDPSILEAIDPNAFYNYQQFLDQGFEYIRRGDYSKVVEHFSGNEAATIAQAVGLFYFPGRSLMVFNADGIPQNLKEAREKANSLAASSQCSEFGQITTANVCFDAKNIRVTELSSRQKNAFSALLLDNALVHAEEWLHGYQMLIGRSVLDPDNDDELDVARVFRALNLPRSPFFVKRYLRESVWPENLTSLLGPDHPPLANSRFAN